MLNAYDHQKSLPLEPSHLDPYAVFSLESGIINVKDLKKTYTVMIELNDEVSLSTLQNLLKNPKASEFPEDFAIDKLSLEMDNYLSKDGGFLTGGFITAHISIEFFNWQAAKATASRFAQFFKSIMLAYDVEGGMPNNLSLTKPLGGKALTLSDNSVIMAVIDDAIPFAHQRFRLDEKHTRFFAAWLQNKNQTGMKYSEQQFNALLQAVNGDEVEFAKAIGQINLSQTSGAGVAMKRRSSHGACVTDLLAGYEEGDVDRLNRPMIGVQLPRPIVEDFSGLTLSPYILSAVYFIMLQSKKLFEAKGKHVPIVINLSYALFSGSRKESHPLGRALKLILDRHNQKYPETPVSLVLAAGNHYQSRSHAILPIKVEREIKQSVKWRVLPDDRTASYVECWLGDTLDNAFQLTLTDPNGKTYSITKNIPSLVSKNINLKLVYNSPLGKGYCVHIALAPTKSLTNSKVVPHGSWEIKILGLDEKNPAHLWILRDDSPIGFPQHGRQSTFEDEHYKPFTKYGRVNENDSLNSTIKRHGTLNAIYAEDYDDDAIVLCGASFENDDHPTAYSSAGYGVGFRAPTALLPSDQSYIRQGILASGIRAGSFTIQNGTSVSAPQLARKIADVRANGNFQPAAKVVKGLVNQTHSDDRTEWGYIAPSIDAKLQDLWRLRK